MYHDLEVRSEAVGRIKAGLSIKQVAGEMNLPYRTVQKWWMKSKRGESLKNKTGKGRKTILSRRAKIVISKSVGKRRQSCRKLAGRLSGIGEKCSKNTINRYLSKTLGCKSYKRQKILSLTQKNIDDRFQFSKMARKMSSEDWKNVIFSNESPFPLFWTPNKQVDRVWSRDRGTVEPVETVKKSQGIQVWGAMSGSGLSELHVMPQSFRLNARKYITDILEGHLEPLLERTRSTGPISSQKLVQNKSEVIFQHDGAPAHTAVLTESWLKNKNCSFGARVYGQVTAQISIQLRTFGRF